MGKEIDCIQKDIKNLLALSAERRLLIVDKKIEKERQIKLLTDAGFNSTHYLFYQEEGSKIPNSEILDIVSLTFISLKRKVYISSRHPNTRYYANKSFKFNDRTVQDIIKDSITNKIIIFVDNIVYQSLARYLIPLYNVKVPVLGYIRSPIIGMSAPTIQFQTDEHQKWIEVL